jgi:hypothetical protein
VPVDEGTEDQEVFVFLLEFDQVPCVVPLLKPWPLPYSLPSRPVTFMPGRARLFPVQGRRCTASM